MDCLFCKIVTGEIPNYTVYQDEHTLAFLDIHPHAKGHTVVVPKQHFESVLEMNQAEWSGMMNGLSAAVKKLSAVLKPDGMNIGVNDRPAGGQAVPHVHWHILPRWQGDGGGSMHSIIKAGKDSEVSKLSKLFKQ